MRLNLFKYFILIFTASFSALLTAGDPRHDLIGAFVKLETAYPYRLIESSSTIGANTTTVQSKRILEMASAENFHIKWNAGGLDMESISLNGKSYYKIKGKWVDTPVSPLHQSTQNNVDINEIVKVIKDAKSTGIEDSNGTQCTTYTFQLNAAEMGMAGSGKAWIGASDGLPRKADLMLNVGEYKVQSVLIYEYDRSIRIVPPAMQ